MRKLKVKVVFTDSEYKKELIGSGKTEEEAKKIATRKINDIFETTDERASVLLNLKYVELVNKPVILTQDEVKEIAEKIADDINGTVEAEPKGMNDDLIKNSKTKKKKVSK